MSVDEVSLALAALAVAAELAVMTVVGIWLSGTLSARARRVRDSLARTLAPDALWLAFVVAAVAMSGSL